MTNDFEVEFVERGDRSARFLVRDASPTSKSPRGVVSGTRPSRSPIISSNITEEFSTNRTVSILNVGTSAIIARRMPLATAGETPRTRNLADRSPGSMNSISKSFVI